jgi:hypothetical protein
VSAARPYWSRRWAADRRGHRQGTAAGAAGHLRGGAGAAAARGPAHRPGRAARRGHRGRHPRAHRSRPVHRQPVLRQAGVRVRPDGAGPGRAVTLVAANTELPDPAGVEVVRVATTEELRVATVAAARTADVVVMAAAPADFRPATYAPEKIKKSAQVRRRPSNSSPTRTSRPNSARRSGGAGTGSVRGRDRRRAPALASARDKMARKRADLIVLNQVGRTSRSVPIPTLPSCSMSTGRPRRSTTVQGRSCRRGAGSGRGEARTWCAQGRTGCDIGAVGRGALRRVPVSAVPAVDSADSPSTCPSQRAAVARGSQTSSQLGSNVVRRLFTSESVTEGHPDKIADQISDGSSTRSSVPTRAAAWRSRR